MDTRSKILTAEGAADLSRQLRRQGIPLHVVTGYFDVLVVEHTRALSRLRDAAGNGKLMAVVCAPAEPVLTPRDRAEMLAALSVIDYVVTAEPGGCECLLAMLEAAEVTAFELDDERRTRQLVEHVHRRQTP